MMLLLAVLLSIIIGYLTHGRLRNFAYANLNGLWLPIVAVFLEFMILPLSKLIPVPCDQWRWILLAGTYACSLGFIYLNRHVRLGSVFLLAGTVSNLAVIAANGWRMPVSTKVLELMNAAGTSTFLDSAQQLKYVVADSSTHLTFLGDMIYCPIPFLRGFASIGDLFLMIGIFFFIQYIMKAKRYRTYYRFRQNPYQNRYK